MKNTYKSLLTYFFCLIISVPNISKAQNQSIISAEKSAEKNLFGVRLGYGASELTGKNLKKSKSFQNPAFGIFYDIKISKYFSFQPEIQFSSRGGQIFTETTETKTGVIWFSGYINGQYFSYSYVYEYVIKENTESKIKLK